MANVIHGMDKLHDKLNALSVDIKYKGGRFALRKAANIVRDAAVKNALSVNDPKTPTEIAKNMAVRWSGRAFKSTGNLHFRVGILGGAKKYANTKENVRKRRSGTLYKTGGDKTNPGGDTWYWRMLEFGTEKMSAQPFLRKSLEQSTDPAINEFITQYNKSIDRVLKKARGKDVIS